MSRHVNEVDLSAGNRVHLRVERRAPFGFFLSDGETDVLLHDNEVVGEVKEGQVVEVFLYHDHQDRLAATMLKPKLVIGMFDWLEVSDVNQQMGVFLQLGIHKELLLSKDDLPEDRILWPQPGDQVFVGIKHDKKGRMLAKLGLDVELEPIAKKGDTSLKGKTVTGHIYRVVKIGAFLFTGDHYIAFLHRDDMQQQVRLGEKVRCRIKNVREDGRLNVTTHPPKAVSYEQDSDRIFQHLKDRGGAMPYSDETAPDVIKQKFHISKSAFKRAIGKLMKEGKVYQEKGWTYIKKD